LEYDWRLVLRASKADIIRNVYIIDIAEENGLSIEECSAGNFDYRCRCPSPEHKDGNERTSSLYIDSVNNNFYCFGCTASSSVIDFYIMCTGKQFSETLSDLESRVPTDKITGEAIKKRDDTLPKLLELSNSFRESIQEHTDDMAWVEKLMKKVDDNLERIDEYDIKAVSALVNKVKEILNKRYG
jgi:DNA primase